MKASYKIALICTMLVCSVLLWQFNDVNSELEAAERAAPPPSAGDGSPVSRGSSGIGIEHVDRARFEADDRFNPESVDIVPTGNARTAETPARPGETIVETVDVQQSEAHTYTIQRGDTFQRVSQRLYGTPSHWVSIAQANPMVDPQKLKPGQVIRLPSVDDRNSSRGDDLAPPGETVIYVVQSGDNLSEIAKRFYGSPKRWRMIYNTNRRVIGDDPAKLKAGSKITIPPVPGD